MSNIDKIKDILLILSLISVFIIIIGAADNSGGSSCGCGNCGCGNCGCGDCGSCGDCGCGDVKDTQGDGSEQTEAAITPEETVPEPPPSICKDREPFIDRPVSGTKSPGATFNTYTYSYSITACNGDFAYDIYLKGFKRLKCESGAVAYEHSKSKSNSVTSPDDYTLICIYSPSIGDECSPLS